MSLIITINQCLSSNGLVRIKISILKFCVVTRVGLHIHVVIMAQKHNTGLQLLIEILICDKQNWTLAQLLLSLQILLLSVGTCYCNYEGV